MGTKKIKRIKEPCIFMFALLCIIFHASFSIIALCGYDYIHQSFDKGYVLLCILAAAQTVALGLTKKASSMILLVLSNLLSEPFFIAAIFTLILFLIKGKKADVIIKCTTVIFLVFSIISSVTLLLITGKFITHYNYKEYASPSENKCIVVMEDHSFNKKVISHVYVGGNSKIQLFGYSFFEKGDLLTRVYHTEKEQNDVVIEWSNENTVLIDGNEYTISKK